MKKLPTMVLYLFIASSAVLAESDDKIGFTLTSDFYSKYVWRGQLLNDDFVFQPSISANYKGWTATAWGNVNMTDYGTADNSGEFTEYDLVLDYSSKLSEESIIGYSIGVIHYHFPSLAATDTTELYWGFNFDLPLNPTFKVYHGLGNENGTYANFSIGHTYEKFASFTETCYCNFQWGASIGWANSTYNVDYWGVDDSRLNDLTFTLALPICFPGDWIVKPSVNYVTLVDGALRDSDVYSSSSDYFFTGVSISKSF
ncbi:MAG: hypothetical protein A2Y10_09375 [Planctomycetes bacterium GWF2_41_51]|nr:MAG: hypothetical protein A2Y10_09375 [Planctomycetes bacterium GWF2_41_51]